MKNHAKQSFQAKIWSQVRNSEQGSSELRGGDLRVQKAMLLGSVEEVLDAWCFFCCIRVLHVYNGLLPFAPGGRVRFLSQLQLLVALVVTVEGAEMGESRKALEAMGHVLHSWGIMRVGKDRNLPTLWSHTSQHSTRRISPCWSCIDHGFLYCISIYI